MPLPQEKTVCRRSTPLYCKLPFEDWLVYRGWSKAEECSSGWSCTEGLHVHETFHVSSVRVWGGPPPCCLCSKCEVAATSSSHSHAAVATNAEAKQQRKNNGNKSYSILKFFSGSCLRENKELLPKPTLVLLQGPNMTEITPVRNFTRAMLCFQSLSWKSCRSSYVWVSFSFSVSAWQWKFSLDPAFPRSCHETAASANRNFKHSCIPACLNGISFLNLFLDS